MIKLYKILKPRHLSILFLFLLSTLLGCNLPPSRSPMPNYLHTLKERKLYRMGPSASGFVNLSRYNKKINVNADLTRVGSLGRWKGRIVGNGEVNLVMAVYDGTKLVDTKLMGSTTLNANGVPFIFESDLPMRYDLSRIKWRIFAS
jgi:hypothetical protein